jgi:hypothetical protein
MLVQTIKGLIPRDQLEVTDIITEGENDRAIATEWRHDGELVRRDVAVSIMCGLSLSGEQAEI